MNGSTRQLMMFLGFAMAMPAIANEVTCESENEKPNECAMNTQGEVRIVKQISHTKCIEGKNWGVNNHSVWVKDGCRAVFAASGEPKAGAGKEWDRGCRDAKDGSYDRSSHSRAYEEGWQSCK